MNTKNDTLILDKKNLDEIREIILNGLLYDGAHHKQWHLGKLLNKMFPDEFDDLKRHYDWEEGC